MTPQLECSKVHQASGDQARLGVCHILEYDASLQMDTTALIECPIEDFFHLRSIKHAPTTDWRPPITVKAEYPRWH